MGASITTPQETKTQNWWYEKTWLGHKHKLDIDKLSIATEEDVIKQLEVIKNNYAKDV